MSKVEYPKEVIIDGRKYRLIEDNTEETFTYEEQKEAISHFINYGECSYVPNKPDNVPGHCGQFSGRGWAARCLRYHLEHF